jgi:hypothetical protein
VHWQRYDTPRWVDGLCGLRSRVLRLRVLAKRHSVLVSGDLPDRRLLRRHLELCRNLRSRRYIVGERNAEGGDCRRRRACDPAASGAIPAHAAPVIVRSTERCASPPASVNADSAKYAPHATWPVGGSCNSAYRLVSTPSATETFGQRRSGNPSSSSSLAVAPTTPRAKSAFVDRLPGCTYGFLDLGVAGEMLGGIFRA